jgi:hypothetical protein
LKRGRSLGTSQKIRSRTDADRGGLRIALTVQNDGKGETE